MVAETVLPGSHVDESPASEEPLVLMIPADLGPVGKLTAWVQGQDRPNQIVTLPLEARLGFRSLLLFGFAAGIFSVAFYVVFPVWWSDPEHLLHDASLFETLWICFISLMILYLTLFSVIGFVVVLLNFFRGQSFIRLEKEGLRCYRHSESLIRWSDIESYTRERVPKGGVIGLRLHFRSPIVFGQRPRWWPFPLLRRKPYQGQSMLVAVNGLSVSKYVIMEIMKTMIERANHQHQTGLSD